MRTTDRGAPCDPPWWEFFHQSAINHSKDKIEGHKTQGSINPFTWSLTFKVVASVEQVWTYLVINLNLLLELKEPRLWTLQTWIPPTAATTGNFTVFWVLAKVGLHVLKSTHDPLFFFFLTWVQKPQHTPSRVVGGQIEEEKTNYLQVIFSLNVQNLTFGLPDASQTFPSARFANPVISQSSSWAQIHR